MKLRKLELDFLREPRPPAWAGWVLLALALTFAADVGFSYLALTKEIARKEARLIVLGERGTPDNLVKTVARPINAEELGFARETIQRLSMPWDNLFAALEAAQIEGVVLLSIEPDPQAGTVTLNGEARDYLKALSYVGTLENQETLTHVHLVRHELKREGRDRSVVFTVSAAWRERR